MVKLIATDMDGTLLGHDQRISDENIDALRAAAAAGIHLAIASGRAIFEIERLVAPLSNLPLSILALNGGCIRLFDGQERLHLLNPEAFCDCVRLAEAAGVRYYFYTKDRLHTNREESRGRIPPPLVVSAEQAFAMAGQAVKFVVNAREPERLLSLRTQVEALGLSVCSSWAGNFEVNPPGVNKGAALGELAQLLGIGAQEVMALGDAENDVSMLSYAGVSVAMGNACEKAAAAARHSTQTNAEHGVALAIRRLALGGR